MLLTESKLTEVLTEGLKHHLQTGTPFYKNIFRPGSEEYFKTIRQARKLMNEGVLTGLCFEDLELLFETEVGEYGEYKGQRVPLDFPMLAEETIVMDPQSTQIINAWNAAKQNQDIVAIINKEAQTKGEEPYALWIDIAGKAKAQMGVAYTIEASAISQYLTEQEQEQLPSTTVIMPIIAKYKKDGNVLYTLLDGRQAYEQIKNTDAEVWVVDLTELQDNSLAEASFTPDELTMIKKIIALVRSSGTYASDDQLATLIANKVLKRRLAPGQVNVVGGTKVDEAKYHGKEVKLNKPMRSSGPKKYKVYTKNAKGNVIVVNFGDAKGGLTAKINNAKARKAFSDRHNCPTKKDKTKAGYWSCRLPRYASLLGLKSSFGGYW